MNTCVKCNKETANPKFCSRSCAASTNNSLTPKRVRNNSSCLQCCAPLKYSSKKYCSVDCQTKYRREEVLEQWRNSPEKMTGWLSRTVRDHLLDLANHRCSRCNWSEIHPITKKVPLEIDHVNGDASDNSLKNLQVLCPNCHSLTTTYRALNKKSSRVFRNKPEKRR